MSFFNFKTSIMRTLYKLTVILFVALTTSSCVIEGFTGIRGNGDVITENRKLNENFDAIKVQQGINVYLTQGSQVEMTVEADDNIMDLLITEVRNGELKIYFEKNVNKATRNVYLTAEDINKIKTSSGASVNSENTISSKNLELSSSSGSSITLKVNAEEINSSTSSGAQMELLGTTEYLSAKASSGSHIDAEDLKSINALAKASSGANIDLYVERSLTAKASSGGDIDYVGNPHNVNRDTSSGGSISGS